MIESIVIDGNGELKSPRDFIRLNSSKNQHSKVSGILENSDE
jgi:hypothetical protein